MITLLSLAAWAQEDIRALKPALPLDEPTSPWWLLGLLPALLLAGGLLWWWRRPRRPLSPTEQLHAELEAAQARLAEGDLPGHADLLTAALRGFIQRTTEVPALHLTTEELSQRLEGRLPEPCLAELRATLSHCDTVRFAGLQVAPEPDLPWVDTLIQTFTAPEPEATDAPAQQVAR